LFNFFWKIFSFISIENWSQWKIFRFHFQYTSLCENTKVNLKYKSKCPISLTDTTDLPHSLMRKWFMRERGYDFQKLSIWIPPERKGENIATFCINIYTYNIYFQIANCFFHLNRMWEATSRLTRIRGTDTDQVASIAIYRRLLHYDVMVLVRQYRPALNAYTGTHNLFIIFINSNIYFNIFFFKLIENMFWILFNSQWNFQLVSWSRVKPAKRQQFESCARKQAGMARWRIWAPDLPWILDVHLPSRDMPQSRCVH